MHGGGRHATVKCRTSPAFFTNKIKDYCILIVLRSMTGETSLIHHQKLILHFGLYTFLTNVTSTRDKKQNKIKVTNCLLFLERERDNTLTPQIEGIPRMIPIVESLLTYSSLTLTGAGHM